MLIMNKLRPLVFLGICSGALFCTAGFAQGVIIGQDTTNRVITTAVPFLGITPDSRSAAMGEVGAATSPDANSGYWNAAKLAYIDKGYGVSGSYTPWLGKIINDMSIFYLSGFYKISREQTVAASMKYFDLGEIQFNNGPLPENVLGRYNPREFAFDVAYSRLLAENFSIGGAIRYIRSNLTGSGLAGTVDSKPGNSVAVDLGVFYTKPMEAQNSNLSFGAAITNLGSKLSYSNADFADFIPINLRLGTAYQMELDPLNNFTFAVDVNKLMVPSPGHSDEPLLSGVFGSFTDARGGFKEEIHEFMLSTGVEYWYNHTFAGRAGYFLEAKDKGNRKYLTAGLGVRYQKFGLDVAYMVPTNGRESALAETIRFTIMMVFDKKESEQQESVTDN